MSPDPRPPAPRTPVLIGVAQVSQNAFASEDPTTNADAVELMARALREAAADAAESETAGVLSSIDTVAVIGGLWRHHDPARLVADELALDPTETILTTFGGQTPIALIADLAQRIEAGEIDAAAVLGGEATASRHRLRNLGFDVPSRVEPDEPATRWGDELTMGDDLTRDRGGELPRNSYAVIDSALRARRGETLDEARDRAATTWAGYAAVAAGNPHAADRSAAPAAAIREPSPDNRMVSWPYTKAMCANNTVDHGSATILCSTDLADRLGVPTNRRVHPHLCVSARDSEDLLERDDLAAGPALRASTARLLTEIGGVDEIGHIDLYGCFPSIVAITAEMLGLDPGRQLTQTGGLGFAGAPLNNAAGESLVAMVQTLRNDPGAIGVVQGNGGHATKHAFGVYSTSVPAEPRWIELGLSPGTARRAPADARGRAVIDGATVEFTRDGPDRAVAACRFDDGTRTWAVSREAAVMEAIMGHECVGRRVGIEGAALSL